MELNPSTCLPRQSPIFCQRSKAQFPSKTFQATSLASLLRVRRHVLLNFQIVENVEVRIEIVIFIQRL